MKRILVTGGAGFLGSHLCEKLLQMGHAVVCLDNFFTGVKTNVHHLLDHPDFELLERDVATPFHVEIDEIYNLACPASPIHYQFDPGPNGEDERPRRHEHVGAGEESQD